MARLEDTSAPESGVEARKSSKSPDDTISEPDEFRGLSLYEKKALLANRELDRHGMGRYQWCIWFLCGFGYLLDLMWAQAFGLVVGSMQAELGFSDAQSGNLSSSFNAGLCAGAFVWGVLVDIIGEYSTLARALRLVMHRLETRVYKEKAYMRIGRKWAFNLTCLFSSAFGLGLGGPSSYNAILVLTAFVGFGVGGNIPIDTTICLEFLPQNRRFLLALLSIFQPLGVVICSGIAYGFIPKRSCSADLKPCNSVAAGVACCTKDLNMGWRYTLFTIGGITLAVFLLRFVAFRFRESPKFLLYRGQDAKAIDVLEKIAKFNKIDCQLSLADLEALTNEDSSLNTEDGSKAILGAGKAQATASFWTKLKIEMSRYKLLFSSWQVGRVTILVWIAYIFDYWAFSVAGFYLPQILRRKNAAIDVSLNETYRNYIIIYLPGVVGVLLGTLMYSVPVVGRKYGMVGSSALMGVSLFVFSAVNTQASNVGLNLMEYFFQSMYNAILYGWTPEVFPAPIRGTACGAASFWGRLFSIVAPIIAGHILEVSLNGVLYLAGATALVSTLAILLIPIKQMGAQSY